MQGVLEDSGARKDANEVLLKDGPGTLRKLLEVSPAYPIKGLYQFSDYRNQIWEAYDGVNEHEKPVSTGWKVLDDFYRVVPGELTIVTGARRPYSPPRHASRRTWHPSARSPRALAMAAMAPAATCAGIPNSGKSEFIDALALSLAQNHYWPIAFCSLEKTVVNHFKDLAEKVWAKPFLPDSKNARHQDQLTEAEARPPTPLSPGISGLNAPVATRKHDGEPLAHACRCS